MTLQENTMNHETGAIKARFLSCREADNFVSQ